MRLRRERELVADCARRMEGDGLATGTAGNLSLRAGDLVAVTPSAVPYATLTPELVSVVTSDGSVVEGEGAPSTELPMHLAVYEATGATAVVHTHPPFATALSTVLTEVPAVHYLVEMLGGPVRVAPYHTPGSEVLADAVVGSLGGRCAVLLANHGALTIGDSLEEAYSRSVLLEWLCAVYHRARAIGEPRLLSEAELEAFAAELSRYGRAEGR